MIFLLFKFETVDYRIRSRFNFLLFFYLTLCLTIYSFYPFEEMMTLRCYFAEYRIDCNSQSGVRAILVKNIYFRKRMMNVYFSLSQILGCFELTIFPLSITLSFFVKFQLILVISIMVLTMNYFGYIRFLETN